ncbi:MAG: elongation factor P maturation arginine rhamnosyltransferase EarP, partial [Burkholderiaceae bacterium]
LIAQSISTITGERRVSLFCYANPALPGLVDALSAEPTLLLVTAGLATEQVRLLLGTSVSHRALRVQYLPPLTQLDYDHLLWSCDLNLVRGEDSFVRAQWAAKPFLWQIYPQHDAAHGAKLAAFNQRFLSAAAPDLRAAVGRATRDWNYLRADGTEPERIHLPSPALWETWHAHCRAWRSHLAALPDLASSLRAFVQKRR